MHCGTTEPVPPHLSLFDPGDPTAQQCPSCNGLLHHASVGAYRVRVCIACGGAFSKMSNFASLIDALRLVEGPALDALPPRTQEPGQRTLACPECREPMRSLGA